MADKPYPWTCGNCAQKRVQPIVQDYQTQFKHDGKLHDLLIRDVAIPTCENCGEKNFGIEQSDRVTQALREKVGLLASEDIRQQRTSLGLNQEQLGECIGAAKESISRWETGALIQSVSTDRLLRMFFKHPGDPIWNNKWFKSSKQTVAPKSEEAIHAWVATASHAYATADKSSGLLQEIMESVERRLLSRLMVEDSLLPTVEARLKEEDFQNALMRFTYHSMRSVFHETGRIVPRRLAQTLAAQASDLPAAPDEIVIFLVDTAVPNTEFNELLELMTRRSQIRRELSESF